MSAGFNKLIEIMSCILHIETSTQVCSVALSEYGQNVFRKEDFTGPSHAVSLGVFVDEALSFADSHAMPVDAVAVSCGPGSYTGLRIGVSMAKGICYGLGVPLIGLPTLKVLCVPVLLYHDELPDDSLLCPMLDARRMEVYTAFFDRDNHTILDTKAEIITADSFADLLAAQKVYFFGNGSEKVKSILASPNACFIDQVETSARHLVPLSEELYQQEQFVDTAYFEPFYLKDFIATVPKKKII